MKFLALIPARGGSKRLPGKNIKVLGGLPLIAWTIRAARDSGVCEDIIVSTDDERIALVAREYGATVPKLRPLGLATDAASSVDVALHVLKEYGCTQRGVDGLILLQPTSPFRKSGLIQRAVREFEDSGGAHEIVSVSPVANHPAWCFRLSAENHMYPLLGWEKVEKRSQDLEPAYALNGAIYVISPKILDKKRRFISEDSRAVIMDNLIESSQ